MRKLSTSLLLFCIIVAFGCKNFDKRIKGNGNVETQKRTIAEASKIKISGSVDVIVDSGKAAVRVEAEENIIPYILTIEDNGWLEVKLKHNVRLSTTKPMRVYVTTPSINAVRIAGSGNLIAENKAWSEEPISIKIGGSGDVTMDVHAPKIDADIAGSGNINIGGETRDVSVSIAGSGNFDGKELKAENADIKIAGSGDATVFADVNLDAKIMGSGNVSYAGNANIKKKILGGGTVKRIN